MKLQKGVHLLTDVQYVKGYGKNAQDALYVIVRDTKTNEKKVLTLRNPTMDIYFEKEEFRKTHDYNIDYTELAKCVKKSVPYSQIIYAIANEIGEEGKAFINNAFSTRNYRALNDIHLYPYVFGSDIDIRTHYRYKWLRDMDSIDTPKILHKACADIEVDSFELPGFPKPESCPIDLVTLIDMKNNVSYTFALVGRECKEHDMTNMNKIQKEKELRRRKLYKKRLQDEEYVMRNQDKIKKQLHEIFDEKYPNMEYKFFFYQDELKMITHIFQLINMIKFDFVQFWNMSFDIPYIIDRIKVLGGNPEEIICPKEFPIKECYYKKDNYHFEIKNRTDYARISSFTVYTDQMRNYAAIRKSSKELRSNKLEDVAQAEIGDSKFDYSSKGNIKTIGYEDYLTYFIYNIKDVLLQVGIENVTSDLDTYFSYSYQNACDYESVFKQTMKLRAAQYVNYFKQGLITGNNINIHNFGKSVDEFDEEEEDDDDAKFEGALVGNPLLINDFGSKLFGKKTNMLFLYSIDMDMSAFYPNSIIAMNINASTLIFKVICNSNQFKQRGGKLKYHGITEKQMVKDNKDSFEGDISKEIFDNFQTKNYISVAEKFMNLPGVTELYSMILNTPELVEEKRLCAC